MRLSIIIPTLNECNNLKVLLPYLHSQTENCSVDIVVVDAYSASDEMQTLCLRHNVFYLKCHRDQRASQMNAGAVAYPNDAYLFLHADVRPPVNFYTNIKEAIGNGFGFGLFAYKFDKYRWHTNTNAYFTKFDGLLCGGGDQCHFMTQKTFDLLDGYCSDHNIMEDFDLFRRLKSHHIPYTLIPDRATVSARKYEKNSYLRVNFVNLISLIRFNLGHNTEDIRKFCKKWIRSKENS